MKFYDFVFYLYKKKMNFLAKDEYRPVQNNFLFKCYKL